MSGERRWGSPHVGDYIHFKVFAEPETWGYVVQLEGMRLKVHMLDRGEVEYVESAFLRNHACEVWITAPDEFYVWQATHVLLKD